MKRTAVLIDGGFFIQRVNFFLRRFFAPGFALTAKQLCSVVEFIVRAHIDHDEGGQSRELYRVYFYDCPPLDKQLQYPLPRLGETTPPRLNCKEHPPYKQRRELQDCLRSLRKTALRLGELSNHGEWRLVSRSMQALIKGERAWSDLTNDDFYYDIDQKAVDLKLGMDITTLALNDLADVIVLVAGDSDFVPAAKLARTNGIDFVLDPMWANPSASLRAHVDGIRPFDVVKMISESSSTDVTVRPDWWPELPIPEDLPVKAANDGDA
ncbi:NYN domain-containing protein [Pseudomonas aeruginosa]